MGVFLFVYAIKLVAYYMALDGRELGRIPPSLPIIL